MRIKIMLANLLILLGVLLVSGCLIPEKFKADATINKDKSYSLIFKGTMVYMPYRLEQNKESKYSPDELAAKEKEMASKIEDELLKKHGDTFKKVRYAGNGVFNIEYAAAGKLTKVYFFPNKDAQIIRFVLETDGTITVQGRDLEKNWPQLQQYGVEVDGTFSLKTDADVLEHNAKKTPGLFSKSYVWEIKPGSPPPHMLLKSSE